MPLVGRSPAMQEIYRVLARLMQTDLTVMISGESGTGKELVARALHDYGKRRNGPFVAINMAAIPRDLIESRAVRPREGRLHRRQHALVRPLRAGRGRHAVPRRDRRHADGGADPALRVLQQGEYTTVGGRTPIKSDVRIVAATNKDLRQLIQQGLFREDLFYRLNVVPLRLPPLRERTEDIPDLVRHFFAQAAARGPAAQSRSTAAALDRHASATAGRATCASWRTWCGGSPRSIRRRRSPPRSSKPNWRSRRCRSAAARSRAPRRVLSAAVERHLATLFRRLRATRCRRPGSITASCARSNIRC